MTSIPLDADEDEINSTFSKCGVIAEEIDSGRPRIKMYENDKGEFKGDALVVYFRPESVNLAAQMLDDTDFRLGQEGPSGKMRVQAADFSYKSQQEAPAKANKKDQKKIIKRTQKMMKYARHPHTGGVWANWSQQIDRLGRRRSANTARDQLTVGQGCHIEAHVYLGGTRGNAAALTWR